MLKAPSDPARVEGGVCEVEVEMEGDRRATSEREICKDRENNNEGSILSHSKLCVQESEGSSRDKTLLSRARAIPFHALPPLDAERGVPRGVSRIRWNREVSSSPYSLCCNFASES